MSQTPLEAGAAEREECVDFQALSSRDATRPARVAIEVFTWVFGFQAGFDLEIGEH